MAESTPAPVEGKICGKCREWKSMDRYSVQRSARDGRQKRCKACNAADWRARADALGVTPRFVAPDGMKRCSRCRQVKPVDEFGYSRGKKDDRQSACRPCVAERSREKYRSDPELRAKHKVLRDRWRAANPTYFAEAYQANREQRIAAAVAYGKAHPVDPALKRARDRAWYAATAEERRAVKAAWKTKNAELVREIQRRGSSRRRARVRELPVEPYTVAELLERDGTDCVLCGYGLNFTVSHPHPMAPTVEHLECISWPESAGDVPSNVAMSHFSCNTRRNDRPHPAAAAKRAELLAAEATAS